MRLVLSPSPQLCLIDGFALQVKECNAAAVFRTCWALFVLVSLKPLETQRFQPCEWPRAPKPARVSKANLKRTASSKIETNSNLAKLWLDSRWNSVTWGKDRKGQYSDGIVMIWAAYASLVHLRCSELYMKFFLHGVLRSAPEAEAKFSDSLQLIQNDPKRHK